MYVRTGRHCRTVFGLGVYATVCYGNATTFYPFRIFISIFFSTIIATIIFRREQDRCRFILFANIDFIPILRLIYNGITNTPTNSFVRRSFLILKYARRIIVVVVETFIFCAFLLYCYRWDSRRLTARRV